LFAGNCKPRLADIAFEGKSVTTAYDRVAYESNVIRPSDPERMAVAMRLAGLDPPDPRRARVLEVGGGNCVNLMSLAAIYPACEAHGFDLSETAIAHGEEIRKAAGLGNVTLRIADILEAPQLYPAGSFDYVIVHGVYAWVPDAVRTGVLALIGHVLSDRGVAMVSYNAMPGGHFRLALREMLMLACEGIDEPEQRIAAMRAFLAGQAVPQADDTLLHTAMRDMAGSMLTRPDFLLFHDELGDVYKPQRLVDVVADAGAHGLRFLSDAGRNRVLDGFLDDDAPEPADPDAEVVRVAALDDYTALRFFRHTLLVRDSQRADRRIDVGRLSGMFVGTRLVRQANGSFSQAKDDFVELPDPALADAVERLAAAAPGRVPLTELARTPEQQRIVLQLAARWYVNLHLNPLPYPTVPGERPETSPLVRGLIALGQSRVCTLEHRTMQIDQQDLRALLLAADGTRTVAELAAAVPQVPAGEIVAALTYSAGWGLMVA
jgi:Methyltransferase domain/Predicted methyltransferase regulatory domain